MPKRAPDILAIITVIIIASFTEHPRVLYIYIYISLVVEHGL